MKTCKEVGCPGHKGTKSVVHHQTCEAPMRFAGMIDGPKAIWQCTGCYLIEVYEGETPIEEAIALANFVYDKSQ